MEELDKQFLNGAYSGILEIVETCIKLGTDVNTKDNFGDTALNKAASNGHTEVVKFLLESGADIENLGGAALTPLMNAATSGQVETVNLLLQNGAKINQDLLSTIQMKVNILEENAEDGMVLPEAVTQWQRFLDYLVKEYKKQQAKK